MFYSTIGQLRAALLPIKRLGDVQVKHTWKPSTFSSFFFLLVICALALSCWISPALLLGVHRGERWAVYLRAIAVVKPARGTTIRFLGSATARPLEADRLRSTLPQLRSSLHRFFTGMERWFVSKMKFYLSLFQLVLLCRFFRAVALLFDFCLELKFGSFKCIYF